VLPGARRRAAVALGWNELFGCLTAYLLKQAKTERGGNGQAERTDLRHCCVAVLCDVQEHHREQEHEHDQEDRADERVSAPALEHVPEPDHEGGMLQDLPARGHINGLVLRGHAHAVAHHESSSIVDALFIGPVIIDPSGIV
jgi:hypothetical protein